MSLDSTITGMIGDIYAAAADEAAWQKVLDGLLQRTGGHFLFHSSVDLKCQHYSKMSWHGAGDGRFLDGMAEYEREMFSG